MKKYISEFIGTLTLVLFGCGIAVVSGGNLLATAFAFGLAIVASAYAIGSISGCHVNPAVSLAMLITKKMDLREFCFYVIAQVLGAITGTGILFLILNNTDFGVAALGANGYGTLSASGITLLGAIVTEVVLTFIFIYTILGVTSDSKKANIAGIVISLTGTSVNPARSLAPAIFLGGEALKQVWVFIVAPFVGSFIAAMVFKTLNEEK